DELLQVIATRLQQSIRKEDTVARLGGDEFAIVSAQANPVAEAAMLAQKLVSLIAQPIMISGQLLTISASVGIGMFPEDAADPATLAKCADMAMYGAKQSGRNAYAFYTAQMTDTALETLAIDRGLRSALGNGELELFYQPQIELASGKIVGIEALIRWHRPQQGLESPAKFIPVAEESDLIDSIGNWVFDEALARLHRWHSAGLPPMRLAINLSARQLRNPRFVDNIRQRLKTFVPADGFCLELEITETVLQTAPHIVNALNELKSLGLQIAIDDFGTGYSSLNSLKHLPVDVLKIDRSFIHGIPEDADDKAIASAIIAMGHNLGMRVIAEGIETEEQLQFLIGQQCDEAQGFLVHPPLRVDECERLLAAGALVHLPVQAKTASTQGTLH
ncbi:MAG TPA: bifunctional diguanylate cyclase/phosphodiesterase, partial [Noviherbaspirillum sp.]